MGRLYFVGASRAVKPRWITPVLLGVGFSVLAVSTSAALPTTQDSAATLAFMSAPPDDAGPSSLTPERLQEDMRFRAALGFRQDEAYVRDLYQRRAGGQLPDSRSIGATLMTAAEAAEADARNSEGTANGLKAREFLQQHNAGALGGIYIDHRGGGNLVVAVTGHRELFEQAMKQVVPYPRRLEVRTVPYSLQQLASLQARILSELPALSGLQVTGIVTNEQENTVDMAVERLSPEVERLIRARYPHPFLRLKQQGPVHLQGYGGLTSPPYRGGQGIWTDKSAHTWLPQPSVVRCTSGFVATAGPGQHYLLTAGHCLDTGPAMWYCTSPSPFFWNQGWAEYGPVHYPVGAGDRCHTYPYTGTPPYLGTLRTKADAARIPINPVHKSYDVVLTRYSIGVMNYAQGLAGDVVGEKVCVSGAASGGERCGTLLARDSNVYTSSGYWLSEQREASYYALGGDSGAPVLDGGIAKGLHVGVIDNGNKIYSHVQNALSVLALTDICGAVRTRC